MFLNIMRITIISLALKINVDGVVKLAMESEPHLILGKKMSKL